MNRTVLLALSSILLAAFAQTAWSQVHVLNDDAVQRQLIDVNETTGAGSIVAELQSFDSLVDLAPAGSGEIYALYAFSTPSIVRVAPTNGAKTLIWNSDPMGPFITPRRLDRGSGGDLVLLTDGMGGSVLNDIDEVTGVLTPRPVPISLGIPVDLAVEPNGDALVLDEFGISPVPTIVRIDRNTGAPTTITSAGYLSSATSMGGSLALDGLGGLYVLYSDRLIYVDLASGTQLQITSGVYLSNFATSGGRIDVDATGAPIAFVSGAVVAIDPLFGIQTLLGSGGLLGGGPTFVDPAGIVVEGGSVFLGLGGPSATFGPSIGELVLASGGQRAVDDRSVNFLNDLAMAPNGEAFVVGDGGLLSADPASGAVRTVTSGGFLGFMSSDITVDPVTGIPYVLTTVSTDGAIIRVDPTTGSQFPVASGGLISLGASMNGIDMNTQGEIFLPAFVGMDFTIIRVDSATGSQTLLPSGGLITSPIDLTIGKEGDIFVLQGMGGIIRKDPITGAESLVVPTPPITEPVSRITSSDTTLFVLQSSIDPDQRVLAIDPDTGIATPLAADGLISFGTDIDINCVPEPRIFLGLMMGSLLMTQFSRLRERRLSEA